ncbi:hypothetical protein [Nostoc cycadae]|uniref:Uncharacterized protein n=1 Tax=Nostoc cycadae WK-1 TaxID=1861711 RepID=A0A2H6LMM9_9NOSO|nr:hypothetical protein [Nostoc cycadae]GBE94464.1 hypothetical protein NCWK1_4240 [Nostoc cycadae WK-1]
MPAIKVLPLIATFLITASITLQAKAVENSLISSKQEGKLLLINDTEYTGIFTIYQPDNKYAWKYVHIPSCHTRSLVNTYNIQWKLSFNAHKEYLIGDVSNSDLLNSKTHTFIIKASDLKTNKQATGSCQRNNSTNHQPVDDVNWDDQYVVGKSMAMIEFREFKQIWPNLVEASPEITNSFKALSAHLPEQKAFKSRGIEKMREALPNILKIKDPTLSFDEVLKNITSKSFEEAKNYVQSISDQEFTLLMYKSVREYWEVVSQFQRRLGGNLDDFRRNTKPYIPVATSVLN